MRCPTIQFAVEHAEGAAHHGGRPLRLRRRAWRRCRPAASAWPTTGSATCRTRHAPQAASDGMPPTTTAGVRAVRAQRVEQSLNVALNPPWCRTPGRASSRWWCTAGLRPAQRPDRGPEDDGRHLQPRRMAAAAVAPHPQAAGKTTLRRDPQERPPSTMFPHQLPDSPRLRHRPGAARTASTATTGCSARPARFGPKRRFEQADWHGQQRAQRERIEFYDKRVTRRPSGCSGEFQVGSPMMVWQHRVCTTSACSPTTTSPNWPRPSSTW